MASFTFAAVRDWLGIPASAPANDPGPVREASPQADDAPVTLNHMVTKGDSAWLPGIWSEAIKGNDDEILSKEGGLGLKLFDALLDDDKAMSSLQQRRLAITSKDWEVGPGDPDDPRAKQAADDFRAMLKGIGFDRVTSGLHFSIWYGYAIGEAMWTTKVHDGRPIIWLDDIIIPDRRWFGFTNAGELRQVSPFSGISGEVLPPNKFVTVRTGGTHDFAFYGIGLAHWCYWPVFFKRAALRFWALYLEKLGQPTVGIEFTAAEKDDAKAKASKLQAAAAVGKQSAVLVPEGTLTNNQLKILEATRAGTAGSGFREFMTEQNDAIDVIILGQPGTSNANSQGVGSNQSDVHKEVRDEIVKADADLICEALNSTIAKWVTRWNYGPDVAPPTVYRVLDEAEDLNTTAERDATLSGIGIKRTEESVREVYGDGYEVDKTPPPVAPGADLAAIAKIGQARKQVAAFAAAFGIDDLAPLYVYRKLLNAQDVLDWAKAQGFKTALAADDLHVTVLYSKTPVDWFDMGRAWANDMNGEMAVPAGGPRKVVQFDGGATVLRFASDDLSWRNQDMIAKGASSDFPAYKPHITISYDAEGVDLDTIEPYTGELRFGPEMFEPIKGGYSPSETAFSAAEEDAITKLSQALAQRGNPVIEAMASHLQTNLEGVTTVEGARVALLDAFESMPLDRLAQMTALPLMAVRAMEREGAELG